MLDEIAIIEADVDEHDGMLKGEHSITLLEGKCTITEADT